MKPPCPLFGTFSISRTCYVVGCGLFLLVLFSGMPPNLCSASDSTLLPDGRQKVELKPAERNPFIQQIVEETAQANPQAGTSEESHLRRIFRAIKLGGISGKTGKKQALLGSLIIKPGDILPPLLKNQFEVLRVVSVDDSAIVLGFVDKDSQASVRQIVIPFNMKPTVSRVMYGEAFEELTKVDANGKIDAPPLTNPGVDDFLKGSMETDLKNVTERDVKMMGVGSNAENSNPKK